MSLDSHPAGHGEPVWEIASLFPPQGGIVDPRDRSVMVLSLDSSSGEYVTADEHFEHGLASSVLLPGFSVDVAAIFCHS